MFDPTPAPTRPSSVTDAKAIEVPSGPWVAPTGAQDTVLLVVSGLLMRQLQFAGEASGVLLGPGDLLCVDGTGGELAGAIRWTALTPTRVRSVELEELTAKPVGGRAWRQVALRASEQLNRTAELIAIGHLARVEDRVLALLWHMAERWGRVTSSGVLVPLDVTHKSLGQLVGARRSTVSLAFKLLASEGHVTRHASGWTLASESLDLLRQRTTGGASLRSRAGRQDAVGLVGSPPGRSEDDAPGHS